MKLTEEEKELLGEVYYGFHLEYAKSFTYEALSKIDELMKKLGAHIG